jgi:hypothetical protein
MTESFSLLFSFCCLHEIRRRSGNSNANSRAKGSASQCQGRDRRTSRHDMSKRQALVAIVVGGQIRSVKRRDDVGPASGYHRRSVDDAQ